MISFMKRHPPEYDPRHKSAWLVLDHALSSELPRRSASFEVSP